MASDDVEKDGPERTGCCVRPCKTRVRDVVSISLTGQVYNLRLTFELAIPLLLLFG